MSAILQWPVARLWSERAICGSGFVVMLASGRPVLLTCAHVVNQCLERSIEAGAPPDTRTTLSFDLPFVDRSRRYEAELIEWFGPKPEDERVGEPLADIAVLAVRESVPATLQAVRPEDFRAPLKSGQTAVGFGYVTDAGTFASGALIGEGAGGWPMPRLTARSCSV